MPFKRYLVVLAVLFLALFLPACAADSNATRQTAGFFFVEKTTFVGDSMSHPVNILVFCDAEIKEGANAIFVTLGGNIHITGYVDGAVLSLFTKMVSTADVKYGIINLKFLFLPFNLLLGLCLLAIFKDFNEQSAAYFEKNKASVLKFGLYGYIMAMLLIGIFFVSVAGAAVAIIGGLILAAVSVAGHVPASVVLGHKLLNGRLREYNIYTLFAAGSVLINIIQTLPAIGELFMFVVMPALSLGIFSLFIIHSRFYKSYVRMSFDKSKEFDRKKINSVILDSINEGGLENEKKR